MLAIAATATFGIASRAFAQEAASATSTGSVDAVPTGEAPSGTFDELSAAPDPTLPKQGFQWGLKLGFELPLGEADDGVSVSGEQFRSGSLSGIGDFRVPIGLDLGYRLNDRWWLGAEAGAGLGPAGDDCIAGATCEWSSLRLGAQVIFHPLPHSALDPWLGLIAGWEWLRGSVGFSIPYVDANGLEQSVAAKARELLSGPGLAAEGGISFSVQEHLRLGPFASAAAGTYLWDDFDCAENLDCPEDSAIDGPSIHLWLGVGVRGTHGP